MTPGSSQKGRVRRGFLGDSLPGFCPCPGGGARGHTTGDRHPRGRLWASPEGGQRCPPEGLLNKREQSAVSPARPVTAPTQLLSPQPRPVTARSGSAFYFV